MNDFSRPLAASVTLHAEPPKRALSPLDLPGGLGDADPAALVRALLQTCRELQRRVESLELSERRRARHHPPHDLSIDY